MNFLLLPEKCGNKILEILYNSLNTQTTLTR